MVHASPTTPDAGYGAFVVREPHRSDVLSQPLKAAFEQHGALPADMMQMLALLSKVSR